MVRSNVFHPKRICPRALLDTLCERTYKINSETHTVVVNQQALDKIKLFFGDQAVCLKDRIVGGGWLWQKEQ